MIEGTVTAFGLNIPQRKTAAGDRLQALRVLSGAGGARLHQSVDAGARREGSRELHLLLTWVCNPGECIGTDLKARTGPVQKSHTLFLLTPRHACAQKGDESERDSARIVHDCPRSVQDEVTKLM